MRFARIVAVLAATAVVVAVAYAIDGLRGRPEIVGSVAPGSQPGLSVPGGVPAVGSGLDTGAPSAAVLAAERERTLTEIDRLIGVFGERVRARADPLDAWFLGRLHLRRAAVAGDVAEYVRAEEALEIALELAPNSIDTMLMLSAARTALHDFRGAASLTEQVLLTDPDRLDVLALHGDAALALGDHATAEEAFRRLEAALPNDPAVMVRLGALAYLTGDPDGATALASGAVDRAQQLALGAADRAWYHAFAGQLYFDLGLHDAAVEEFNRALDVNESFAAALEGLAWTYAGQGRTTEAIDLHRRLIAGAPDPHPHALLGDLYVLAGDSDAAEEQYAVVEAIGAELDRYGAAFDRDIALFHADRVRDVAEALRLAEQDLENRQDPYAFDTYAWALFRNGRFAEARAASDQALDRGTPDAAFWYHAGLISDALGDTTRAVAELERALEINPGFDPILATHARETLDQLDA